MITYGRPANANTKTLSFKKTPHNLLDSKPTVFNWQVKKVTERRK